MKYEITLKDYVYLFPQKSAANWEKFTKKLKNLKVFIGNVEVKLICHQTPPWDAISCQMQGTLKSICYRFVQIR